ncbi:hypothetical protein P5V15_000395 [Pogonomyrmex californicus]
MKNFMFAMCMLSTIVYAFDCEELNKWYRDLQECANTLPSYGNESQDLFLRIDVLYCALSKRNLINENLFDKDECYKYCEAWISDSFKVDICKNIVSQCIDTVNQNRDSYKEADKAVIECTIRKGVTSLFDKSK